MPPRLPFPSPAAQPTLFLLPFRHHPLHQCRHASILASLSDNKGAYNKRIRRGRGPSSGKGKTSGRGHKGQRQHGKVPAGFQGGQTPVSVVHGDKGPYSNQFSLDLAKVNLDRIQSWIDQGRLDIAKPITLKEIHGSRLTHGIKDGVKLLARNANELRSPIHITVSRASESAIAAVEAAGGSVTTRYYTRQSIRRILRGETHPTLSLLSQLPPWLSSSPISASSLQNPQPTAAYSTSVSPDHPLPSAPSSTPPSKLSSNASEEESLKQNSLNSPLVAEIRKYKYRLPDPAGRKDLEYYRDPAHRGYLSYQLQVGQGPSLFFKTPKALTRGVALLDKGQEKAPERVRNKIW